jgi:hypothetical protein
VSTRKNLEGCHPEGDGLGICAYVEVASEGRCDGWMDVMDWGMDKVTGTSVGFPEHSGILFQDAILRETR